MDLLTAVKVESLEIIKELVKKQGISSDSKWTDYQILNVALEYGRKDVASFLLDQNCRVNKTKKSSAKISTPLHNAVKLGDVKIVKKLLEKQASVLAVDSEKNTPLHLAFINKRDILVDLILDTIQQTSSHINLKNNQGLSHLHIACTAKNGQTIQGFLDAGANVDDTVDEKSSSWAGFTAMHFAVNYKCVQAVNILLDFGAKHESKTSKGKTPLDMARQNVEDLLIIIDLLKNKSSDYNLWNSLTNFHVACLQENDKLVEKFIKFGVDFTLETPPNLSLCPSSSLLHCAVVSKCKKKVELLLKHGFELDSYRNSEDMTALHVALYNEEPRFAEEKCTVEIVDLLYAALDDKMLDREDVYGMSYFHIAVTRNDLATVKKYLDEGNFDANKVISDNPYDFCNYSPLHLAVEYQHPEIVELLIDQGADINAIAEIGTPLHVAFYVGDIDLIDLLLKKGARVDLVDPENKQTVLQLLLSCYDEEVLYRGDHLYKNNKAILLYIEHLVKLGVDVNAKDVDGNTALHEIDLMEDNHLSYFQLLLDLGADVNIENNKGILPFRIDSVPSESDYNRFLTYYHHVQKLKAVGIKIHPKNEEFCKKIAENGKFEEGELALKQQQRLSEIVKLKSIKLEDVTTLRDFLKLDSRRADLFAQSKTLRKIAMDSELKEKYPLYWYLIRLQYNAAVKSYKSKNCQHRCDKREVQ